MTSCMYKLCSLLMVEICVGLTIYVTDARPSWFRDDFTSRGFICCYSVTITLFMLLTFIVVYLGY